MARLHRLGLLVAVVVAEGCHHPPAARAPAGAGTVFCTQIACSDELVVELRRDDGRAPAFALTVMRDGKTTTCAAPGPQEVRCGPDVTSSIVGGDRAQQVVEIRGTPASVEIELRNGARVVGKKRFVPRYQQRQPNGPGCPPVCRQATEAWRLS
jgi:hypothetical protein